ncbi:MAG: amidohydrolase [Anaerolineae bacterium]|nr:amidohydrolase [Anaerolineae bacterium]
MLATLVLTNGKVMTMDEDQPQATALAVQGDRIVAVGSDGAMKSLLAPGGEWLDLGGRTVTPGLVDAHVHFQWYSLGLQVVDLFELPSLDVALDRVRLAAAAHPDGQWLRGRGWKHDLWPDRAWPTAAHLDIIAPHIPIYLTEKSGHSAWVNSLALKMAGITSHTPDPEGGQIQRDENGQPTGILLETAINLVSDIIPQATVDEIAAAMRVGQKKAWQAGLTGIHDFDGPYCFRALQQLRQNGELGLRVVKNIPAEKLDQAIAVGLQTGFGDHWLQIGGIKIFADGALGPRTALMIEPYQGEPDNRGLVVTDKEMMKEIASAASLHGLSVTVHAIGDRANHDILDVYEAVRQEEAARGVSPFQRRHRIEHVQILHPSDIPRLARHQIIASMQPIHATGDMAMADRYWGERAQYSYAWRTLTQTGALLVFGSDAPVESIEPIRGIHAAATRRQANGSPGEEGWYPAQRLSLEEAIRGFTMAAALTSGQEQQLGSITPGKLADLTIFDRDITAIPPHDLRHVTIDATIVGGAFKYRQI